MVKWFQSRAAYFETVGTVLVCDTRRVVKYFSRIICGVGIYEMRFDRQGTSWSCDLWKKWL